MDLVFNFGELSDNLPYQIGVIQEVHWLNLFEEVLKDSRLRQSILLEYFDCDAHHIPCRCRPLSFSNHPKRAIAQLDGQSARHKWNVRLSLQVFRGPRSVSVQCASIMKYSTHVRSFSWIRHDMLCRTNSSVTFFLLFFSVVPERGIILFIMLLLHCCVFRFFTASSSLRIPGLPVKTNVLN